MMMMMKRIKKIKNFLISPHAYYYYPGNLFAITALLFVSAFIFLYLFEPFQVNFAEHNFPFITISLLQALISSLIFAAYFLLLFVVRKKPVEKGWTLGKELKHLTYVLLLMGSGNFLLRPLLYSNPENWSLKYYIEEVGNTYLVGVLLILIFMPLNHWRLKERNFKLSSRINSKRIEETCPKESQCFIKTQLDSGNFHLKLNDFLFARAEGNYIMIFLTNNNEVEKYLKRMTLSQLENQLKSYSNIFRTHRAYLVNLQQVTQVNGNAQGLQLTLKNSSENIPVARSKISDFRYSLSL